MPLHTVKIAFVMRKEKGIQLLKKINEESVSVVGFGAAAFS